MYDDDDYEGRTDYDYAYGDSLNMNDPSVQLQFEKCLQTKNTQATPTATPHTITANPSKPETINNPPYMYDTLQLLFVTTHYETIKDYIDDEFPLYKVPHYITRKKHPSHNNYLYR